MVNPLLLSKRAVMIISAVLLVGTVAFAALVYTYIYQPPQFSAYVTSVELNGSSVEKAELFYTDVDKFVKMGTTYKQTYGSGVVLSQSRFGGWRPESCSWYNTRIFVDYTTECHHYDLKGDDAYRIVIRRQGDDIVSLFASAKLGNTNLHIHIPKDQFENFVDYENWEQYFRSLKPKSLLFVPREYRPSPLREG